MREKKENKGKNIGRGGGERENIGGWGKERQNFFSVISLCFVDGRNKSPFDL